MGAGKKRCRKALSRERDPLTKVRWACVTTLPSLPLYLAVLAAHPYPRVTIRDVDDVLLLLWSREKKEKEERKKERKKKKKEKKIRWLLG